MRDHRGGRRDGPGRRRTGRREVIADGERARGSRRRRGRSGRWSSTTRTRADRLVAEVNQGGDMVATLIRQVDPMVPFRRGAGDAAARRLRAEPVAALYEQGRIRHRGAFRELEAQMAAMTVGGFVGRGSPDRVDALVWAITELMIEPPRACGLDSVDRGVSAASDARRLAERRGAPRRNSGASVHGLAVFPHVPRRSRRRRRPRPRRRSWPFRAPGGWPGRRATPRR